MILDSNVPHKVPATSSSEDSHEIQPRAFDSSSATTSQERRDAPTPKVDDDRSDIEGIKVEKPEAIQDRDGTAPNDSDSGNSERKKTTSEIVVPMQEDDATGQEEAAKHEDREHLFLENYLSVGAVNSAEHPLKIAFHTTSVASFPLLPSPLPSFDHAMMEKPCTPRHRRSPASTTFPFASLKKQSDNDDESFNLFNQSFDTMSETETCLLELYQTNPSNGNRATDDISPSFSMLGLGGGDRQSSHHRRDGSTPHFDISLPALGHTVESEISPMRVVHGDESGASKGHRPTLSSGTMEPIPVHFPTETEEDALHRSIGVSDQAPALNGYGGNVVPNPFFVLRCSRRAFSKCTFLLSCLRDSDPCTVNVSGVGSFHHYQAKDSLAYLESTLTPQDIRTAELRVGSAICAFGGSVKPEQAPKGPSSIFRPKGAFVGTPNYVRTPYSGPAYAQSLQHRYFVGSTHLSWEVEESPPVVLSGESEGRSNLLANIDTSSGGTSSSQSLETGMHSLPSLQSPKVVEMTSSGIDPPKMKYRCKLCGQPKQSHNCPYRQSVQRSIGVTVNAVVNPFTAHEPGRLTPALSEMNNFISYDSDHEIRMASLPSRSPRQRRTHTSVTPETALRSAGVLLSPESSHSTRTPSPASVPPRQEETDTLEARSRKRSHSEMEAEMTVAATSHSTHNGSFPFAQEVQLRPEQYRAISRSKTTEHVGAYQYSVIPMTYFERKKLIDTLFAFCRDMLPSVVDECSALLNDARMRGMWDLAVAELLTQVVVALYCEEGDRHLEGLQQYLQCLGVAC